MTKIDDAFIKLKEKKEGCLAAYVCGGDPDLRTSADIAAVLEKHADIIELGIPFSDPMADGQTIQKAMHRALAAKTKPADVFEIVSSLKKPVAIMTYYNMIYKYGLQKFCRDAEKNGVSGIIVPDMPPEEAGELMKYSNGLNLIFLASLASSNERIKFITDYASGFVYLVSVTGTTGARKEVNPLVKEFLPLIKSTTNKPIMLGFGISEPSHIRTALEYGADGAIVGSAIISRIEQNLNKKEDILIKVDDFCRIMKEATKTR